MIFYEYALKIIFGSYNNFSANEIVGTQRR